MLFASAWPLDWKIPSFQFCLTSSSTARTSSGRRPRQFVARLSDVATAIETIASRRLVVGAVAERPENAGDVAPRFCDVLFTDRRERDVQEFMEDRLQAGATL